MERNYLPRYIQIQNYIKKQIEDGIWQEQNLIPTESELMKQFDVSRITVTTALRNLANEGWIIRVQGKGSYVGKTPNKSASAYDERSGLIDQLLQMAAPGEHKIRKVAIEIPTGEIAAKLQLPYGERAVICERLKYSGTVPFAIESICLPEALFPGILQKDLENIFMGDLLAREYDIKVGSHVTRSELINADEQTSGILEIPLGAPLLLSVVEVYDVSRKLISYMKFICRGDMFQPIIWENTQ